jgi:hypothetical protein
VWKVAAQRSRNHLIKASHVNLAVTNGLVDVAVLFILVHARDGSLATASITMSAGCTCT